MSSEVELRALLKEIDDLPYTAARVARSEEAVRLADRLGSEQAAWDARMALVTSATFAGFIDKGLVAFSWCASKSAADPEQFPASRSVAGLFLNGIDLLWAYKWIVQHMPFFAGIGRPHIEATLDEMERRYVEHRQSLRPVWLGRARAAMELGDRTSFDEAVEAFVAAPRDLYADCAACEAHFEVEAAMFSGDVARAAERFEQMRENNSSCAEVPHLTYAVMAAALAPEGDSRARLFADRAHEMCADNRDFLSQQGDLIDAEIEMGDVDRAWEIAQRYFGWAAESRVDARRLRFFAATERLTRLVDPDTPIGALGQASILADCRTAGDVPSAIAQEIDRLASAFDARNGNSAVSDRVRIWRS